MSTGAPSLGASLLTFFSGFGLGTLLLPAFALVAPLDGAVAATAVVHLANNVAKGGLSALDRDGWLLVAGAVALAVLAALVGARLLRKATMPGVRALVGALLLVLGPGIALGLV